MEINEAIHLAPGSIIRHKRVNVEGKMLPPIGQTVTRSLVYGETVFLAVNGRGGTSFSYPCQDMEVVDGQDS